MGLLGRLLVRFPCGQFHTSADGCGAGSLVSANTILSRNFIWEGRSETVDFDIESAEQSQSARHGKFGAFDGVG